MMSTKTLVKIFWSLGVRLARCCAGSVHCYIGGYVLNYVVTLLLQYGEQLILKKFYHDPTRYLGSQFLGAINAQKGSFNVS